MKAIHKIIALGALLGILSACNDLTVGPEPINNPEKNFELLWQEYDRLYGLFEVKQINWSAVYEQYRPQVQNSMTDAQFYDLITRVLDELHDGHVWLVTPGPNPRRHDSGSHYERGDFSLPLVQAHYLVESREIDSGAGKKIVYGKLAGNLGYVHFPDFGQPLPYYKKVMDDIVDFLRATKGIVVDVRDHEGGDDRVSQYVAGRFATQRHLYMRLVSH